MTPLPLRLAALAAAAALLAGCASTVSGQGSFAGGPTATSTAVDGVPFPVPTDSGSETATPTETSTPDPTDSGTGSGDSPDSPCAVISQPVLDQAFGPGAKVDNDPDSCRVTSADGSGFMSLSVYQYLDLDREKTQEPGGKASTIAGRPAYTTKNQDEIAIARSTDSSKGGLIVCLLSSAIRTKSGGIVAITKLLEQVVPHYYL